MVKKYELISVRALAERVNEYVIYAPEIAKHCLAGQFVILRVDEDGERVPFTICDYSREDGTVCILVQVVGYTTALLARMKTGECLADLVGPLGRTTGPEEGRVSSPMSRANFWSAARSMTWRSLWDLCP